MNRFSFIVFYRKFVFITLRFEKISDLDLPFFHFKSYVKMKIDNED